MSTLDEKWLFERDLAQLEADRAIYDLDGWQEAPVVTFSAGNGAKWVEGDVNDEDRRVAAQIRERVKRTRG